jgi:hypothetical protein
VTITGTPVAGSLTDRCFQGLGVNFLPHLVDDHTSGRRGVAGRAVICAAVRLDSHEVHCRRLQGSVHFAAHPMRKFFTAGDGLNVGRLDGCALLVTPSAASGLLH